MRLQVFCENRMGIAREILDILVQYEIDVHGIEADHAGRVYLNFPNLEFETFKGIMPQIRMIPGVVDVSTVPYMPLEREQQELKTLMRALPEPIISVDPKGNIVIANNAAQRILKLNGEQAKGTPLKQWIKGFNVNKWLAQKDRTPQSTFIQLKNTTYLCDIHPLSVSAYDPDQTVQAGAVLTFKSPERLGRQVSAFQQTSGEFDMVVAESAAMKKLIRQAKKLSQLDAPFLLVGDIGTGKELLAKSCHQHSLRRDHGFVIANIGGMAADAVDRTLFGGVENGHPVEGLIVKANRGTLFIDDVELLPAVSQRKLLSFLQDHQVTPETGDMIKEVDCRIIAATSDNLLECCDKGEFRSDLYYRLNVLTLHLPNLQERRTDILPLADHFITRFSESQGKFVSLSTAARNMITQYPWPGNVRQLENALLRAVSLLEGDVLEPEHLHLPNLNDDENLNFVMDDNFEGTLDSAVRKFEAELLRRLYPAYPSSRQLGKKLGVSHTAIANKLRDYGIGKTHQKKTPKTH
jgi:transcriptional regulator of aroF, aroG, tyrA and aromatic amino acid transport